MSLFCMSFFLCDVDVLRSYLVVFTEQVECDDRVFFKSVNVTKERESPLRGADITREHLGDVVRGYFMYFNFQLHPVFI